jgi:DNA invertase Pin-like site-specific DNA recombinase
MKKAVIYTRVSTAEQANQGFSLQNQAISCDEFAKREELSVIKTFIEKGESAKTTDRTALKKMIEFCIKNKKEIDCVIVWKFDRLTRKLDDQITLLQQFKKYGIKVLSVTENNEENATGNLMRNIIGSFAQYENDVKSERVTAGMRQAFLEGKWLWRPPAGYQTFNGNIVPDEKTAPYVRKAFELFETGLYQQSEIISILAKDGFRINANHICRMLKNPVYCGIMVNKKYADEPIKGTFEPVVSEKTFYKVQEILEGKRPHTAPHLRQNPIFPLKQFIT